MNRASLIPSAQSLGAGPSYGPTRLGRPFTSAHPHSPRAEHSSSATMTAAVSLRPRLFPGVRPVRLHCAADPRAVYALSAATGALAWKYATGAYLRSTPALSFDGASLFFGSGNGYLYALRVGNGTLLWRTGLGSSIEGSPALSADGSSVFVGSNGGIMSACSSATGSLQWQYYAGGAIRSSPAIAAVSAPGVAADGCAAGALTVLCACPHPRRTGPSCLAAMMRSSTRCVERRGRCSGRIRPAPLCLGLPRSPPTIRSTS